MFLQQEAQYQVVVEMVANLVENLVENPYFHWKQKWSWRQANRSIQFRLRHQIKLRTTTKTQGRPSWKAKEALLPVPQGQRLLCDNKMHILLQDGKASIVEL